jgi:hypothetical protein
MYLGGTNADGMHWPPLPQGGLQLGNVLQYPALRVLFSGHRCSYTV